MTITIEVMRAAIRPLKRGGTWGSTRRVSSPPASREANQALTQRVPIQYVQDLPTAPKHTNAPLPPAPPDRMRLPPPTHTLQTLPNTFTTTPATYIYHHHYHHHRTPDTHACTHIHSLFLTTLTLIYAHTHSTTQSLRVLDAAHPTLSQ